MHLRSYYGCSKAGGASGKLGLSTTLSFSLASKVEVSNSKGLNQHGASILEILAAYRLHCGHGRRTSSNVLGGAVARGASSVHCALADVKPPKL